MGSTSGLRQPVLWYTLLYCLRILKATEPASITEHCILDIFEAECPDDHIIVMQSALYGRMRLGRCIQGSSGNVGCVADVITYFDGQCSAKQVCSVEVASRSLLALSVCPDYTPYLEVIYNCIPVIGGNVYLTCRSDGSIILSGHNHAEGFISSSNYYNNLWGSIRCPWVIEAEPGQKINISIIDFGLFEDDSLDIGATCRRYIMIAEVDRTQPPRTVCSSRPRERNVYISQSHNLEIRFVEDQDSDTPPNFLLKYAVLGCPDPETRGNILDDRTMDKAVLYCARSGKRFHLNCHGNSWDSQAEHCEGYAWSMGDIFPDSWTPKQAMLIVLGIGIGLGIVIGLCILSCAFLCLKRIRRRYQEQPARYSADCGPPQEPYGGAKPKDFALDSADTGYHTYVRRKTSTMSYAQACDNETLLVGTARKPKMPVTDYARHPAHVEPTNSDIAYAHAHDSVTLLVGTCRKPIASPTDYARYPVTIDHNSTGISYADADDDQVHDKPS